MEKDAFSQLEQKRRKMIESGMKNGLQNPKTIRLSKQLDRLMNEIDFKGNFENKSTLLIEINH